jgi:hypothetical protein
MSNVNTTYADFNVVDYKNSSTTLSSYNLSITPLTFYPIIPSDFGENVYVVWDFGDTTSSKELIPTHNYTAPGNYTIKLFVYDKYNQAVRANISKTVLIKDYIEDTFNVTYSGSLNLSCGKLSNTLQINQTLPFYYTDSTINYSVSGSNSLNYYNLDLNKYNHLARYNSLFAKSYIPSSNTYELVELKSINLPLSSIYVKLVNGTLTSSLTSDASSIVAGFSGIGSVFYRDDIPTSIFNLTFNRQYDKYINSLNINLTGNVVENKAISKLSITSNGVDGDSEPLSSFNINNIKFNKSKIHFVIKLKDSENNTIKNVNPLVLNGGSNNSIAVRLVGTNNISVSSYTISSLQSTLTSLSSGGYFRGYIEYTDDLTTPLTGVSLSANATSVITISGTTLPSVQSVSTLFDIYPSNYYSIYKKGEDIDGEALYKSLRFQETLLDKEIFFGNFLGSIFGNADSDPEALSKKINERISNFIDNNSNIDTAEIVRLLSMSQMLDNSNTVFDQNLSNFPNKIQRLVSLLSVKRSKLFGVKNKFVENFNSLGRVDKDIYGKNLGDQIDPYTYIVIPGVNIVAYEKFSRKYTLLNTYQPLLGTFSPAPLATEGGDELLTEGGDELLTENYYLIIDYNDTWGWPLILPTGFAPSDIPTYYDFYEFTDTFADDYVGGILDMNLTTIDNTSDSTYDTIILDTLYQSLSLKTN